MHIDYDLAPYVLRSFRKHFRNTLIDMYGWDKKEAGEFAEEVVYSENFGKMKSENEDLVQLHSHSLSDYEKVWKIAHRQMEREGKQATEGFYHNLNTLESRPGGVDCPFVQ